MRHQTTSFPMGGICVVHIRYAIPVSKTYVAKCQYVDSAGVSCIVRAVNGKCTQLDNG